jgi:hypothetical protein
VPASLRPRQAPGARYALPQFWPGSPQPARAPCDIAVGQPLEKNLENQLAGDLLHLLMAGPAPLCVVLGLPVLQLP